MTLFAIVLFDVRPFPLLVIIKNKVIKLIKKKFITKSDRAEQQAWTT